MMIPRADLDTLRQEAERLGARRVLEFGPGHSTYAFLGAGCHVVTLEHSPYWHGRARERFRGNPRVKIVCYLNLPVVSVPALEDEKFDLAFVDSPQGVGKPGYIEHAGQEGMSRYNTVRFALKVAPVVLLHDAQRKGEQAALFALGARARWPQPSYPIELIGERERIARILQPVVAHAVA